MNREALTGNGAPFLAEPHRIMATAAMFEDEFTVDWLMEMTGLKAHLILSVLAEEVEKKILASSSPGMYTFRTAKKRESLQALLDPAEKSALRNTIVDLLIRDLPDGEDKWPRLSRHLLHTNNDEERCRLLSLAGDYHRKTFDTQKAFLCYTKVLEDLAERGGEEADRLFTETAVKYSKYSAARHDTARVIDVLHSALQRAEARDNIPGRAMLELHLAKNQWLRGRFDLALEHFERGWSLAESVDDPQVVDSISAFATFFLFWQGRFHEAVESYDRTSSDVQDYPSSRFPLLGVITVGYCWAQTGRFTQGLGMLDAIRTHCLERGDKYLAAYAAGNLGLIMLDTRKLDDCVEYMHRAEDLATESNNRFVWITTQVSLALAEYLRGNQERALAHLTEFLKQSRQMQTTVLMFPYLLDLAWAMKQGSLPEVKGLSIETEIERAETSSNIYLRGLSCRYMALLLGSRGAPPEEVIASHQASIEILIECGHELELARSRLELARYLLSLGRKDEARELIDLAHKVMAGLDESLMPDDLRRLASGGVGAERTLDEILKLGQELVRIQNSHDLAKRIISTGASVTGAERGAIFICDDGEQPGRCRTLRASKNLTPQQIGHEHFRQSLVMIEESAVSGRPLIFGTDGSSGAPVEEGLIRSKICVPMMLHEKVIGVLYYDNRLLPGAFDETDEAMLSYFAGLAAIALDNARAYDEISRLNQKLHQEKQYYEEEHLSHLHFDEIVGKSAAIKRVLAQIEQVADAEATVLITGETGVGKELVARAIQKHSPRRDGPFIGVQLSTLPEGLAASELLGHEKGAFTGADRRRIGRFELADGGTLFLDEIGDISPDIQVRLLRVLQTKSFERVGGVNTLNSDFRLIAATNRDLEKAIRESRFRADLFYRLNVFPIHVPPLRARIEDVPLLAHHFLSIYAAKLARNVEYIPEREMNKLLSYDWPGNVRELQNVIERGVILSSGPEFRMPELGTPSGRPGERRDALQLDDVEKRHITRVLEMTGWKVSGAGGAAEILGLHPSTLSFRMKKLGVKRPGKSSRRSH